MLFRQKGKIPDVGKDNFHDFMRSETISQAQTKSNKMTYNTQHLANINQVQTPTPSQLIADGSCKAAGQTWDANHLDSFLRTSKFAFTGEHIFKSSINKAQTADSILKEANKQSYFLRNKQPRLAPEKSAAHYFYQSPLNHLVTRPEEPNINLGQELTTKDFINTKMLKVAEKNYNQEKMYYTPLPEQQTQEKVTLPSQRRKDLQETKKNLDLYQKWREDFFQQNKAYRVAKNGFRSGIISIDNPELPETILYKSEQEQWNKSQFSSTQGKKQRESLIDKFTKANPSIEFDNKKYHEKTEDNKKDELLNKNKMVFPEQNFEMHSQWNSKKEVVQAEDRKNTRDRLFGNNLEEIKLHTINQRALFLRSQELRGRNYDILSMTKNDLPILK